jgi:glucokinase
MSGLVVNVDSTDCRFALTPMKCDKPELLYSASLKTVDYPSRLDTARALDRQPGDREPRCATFAVGGSGCGVSFAAVSLSRPVLPRPSLRTIGPSPAAESMCSAVLGPGTGLGMGAGTRPWNGSFAGTYGNEYP